MISIHTIFKVVLLVSLVLLIGLIFKVEFASGQCTAQDALLRIVVP